MYKILCIKYIFNHKSSRCFKAMCVTSVLCMMCFEQIKYKKGTLNMNIIL